MTEEQAKQVASDFITRSNLESCRFESIRFFPKASIPSSLSDRDEWVATFAFEPTDDVVCSTELAIVVIDDATGETQLCESL